MKLVAILLICLGFCYALEDPCQGAHLKSIFEKCLIAHGGNRVIIDDYLQLKRASDEDGQCFRACIFNECNYFGDDGKFNDDTPARLGGILHGGNESHVKAIEDAGAKCLGLQTYDNTFCTNAEDFTRCMVKHCTVQMKLYGVFD